MPRVTKEQRKAVMRDMAKQRWKDLSPKQRSEAMRLVAAGRGKPKERCPCGLMTLDRALRRGHVDSTSGKCRPGVGL